MKAILLLLALLAGPAWSQGAEPSLDEVVVTRDKDLYKGTGAEKLDFEGVKKLAESGDASAQNELGRRFGVGIGVARDPVQSARWYAAGAQQGLAQAQANLAYMYLNGEGVERSFAEARAWSLKAARQGHYQAQYTLGYMYIMGLGVAKNGPLAERWFFEAARQGHVMSQQALLRMYRDGDGVERDPDKAVMWLHRIRDGQLAGRGWKEPGQ